MVWRQSNKNVAARLDVQWNLPIQLNMDIEKDYGKCIAVYNGKGKLTFGDGSTISCEFQAGQLQDGQLFLLCLAETYQHSLYDGSPVAKFEGVTTEGYLIQSLESIREVNYLSKSPRTGFPIALRLKDLSVEKKDLSVEKNNNDINSVRFGITNLEFFSNRIRLDGRFHKELPLRLNDGTNDCDIKLRPLERYDEIIRRVHLLRNAEVTCEIVADVNANGGLKNLLEVVDNVCRLSSVARGTKVQWLYCDQIDDSGDTVKIVHYPHITKPYCGLTAIDHRKSADDFKNFMETCYPTYVAKRDEYQLAKGTIDAFLSAKAEEDYLETRGGKLAIALERFKAAFHKRTSSPYADWILNEEDFNDLIPKIKTDIRDLLDKEELGSPDLRGDVANEGKILGLNRVSFSTTIRRACKEIKMSTAKGEIRLFVQCRNKLIHEGDFYSVVATPEEKAEVPPKDNAKDEYYFMVNFLDRFFLKFLGYSGDYINWYSWSIAGGTPPRESLP